MKRLILASALAFAVSSLHAQSSLQLTPFTYDPGNVCDEQAAWITGINGLVAGESAIFLKKGCTTATEAAAGVDVISSLEGGDITALTELNFDVLNGGHCGAGAPRFNVVVDGTTYFLGCTAGVHTAIDSRWTHVEFTAADFAAAGIPTTGTLEDIYIIFDEGTDTPTGGTIGTAGSVVIDNISVNNQVVGSPSQPMSANDCKNGGWMKYTNPPFKNQGQCVSSVVSRRIRRG
jgi:hypothetical protein